jgi:transcriptional regulator with XRE-family HTH domain
MNKESVGARIRRLRRTTTDLNQAELARAIKIDPATLNQIEKEKRQPSADTISKLAERLGVSRDYLMDGIKDPPPRSLPPLREHAETTETAHAGTPTARQDFGFSQAIQATVYATLAAIFAGLAADLAARAEADTHREAKGDRTIERSSRPASR